MQISGFLPAWIRLKPCWKQKTIHQERVLNFVAKAPPVLLPQFVSWCFAVQPSRRCICQATSSGRDGRRTGVLDMLHQKRTRYSNIPLSAHAHKQGDRIWVLISEQPLPCKCRLFVSGRIQVVNQSQTSKGTGSSRSPSWTSCWQKGWGCQICEGGAESGCHKHQDVSIAWEFFEFWVNEMYWKELPPGIRGRFTEIFVDEVGWIVSCLMKLNSQIGSSSEGHAIHYCVFLGFMLQLWAHTVFSKSNLSVLLWTLCLGLNLPNHKADSTNSRVRVP